jgi:hypothetical protein
VIHCLLEPVEVMEDRHLHPSASRFITFIAFSSTDHQEASSYLPQCAKLLLKALRGLVADKPDTAQRTKPVTTK